MYTVEFEGNKYPVSASTFFSLVVVPASFAFGMIAWALFMFYHVSSMVGYHTGIPSIIAAIGIAALVFQFNDKSILPKNIRQILKQILIIATLIHLCTVANWSPFAVILLSVPMLVAQFNKSIFKYFKNSMQNKIQEIVKNR